MATQADLDRAAAWARAQVGKPYKLGTFGDTYDCSTFMSGIATMIRDGQAKRWFTTHPFHSGAAMPLVGWERNLQAPFVIGITAAGIGHTGGTLLGIEFEATPPAVRCGPAARGATDPMYTYRYGFRPSILTGATMVRSVRSQQSAVNGLGYAPPLLVDGILGPLTLSGVRWLQARVGTIVDGDWGPMTEAAYLRYLAAHDGEPAHDYARTTHSGRTVNQRTKAMLLAAERALGHSLVVTQGSYNRGVSASAGTHDGGGVVDLSAQGMTSARRRSIVLALRRAGFFAWLRTPEQGFAYHKGFAYHFHAVAIGDREMSAAARRQQTAGFNDRDALARNGPDPELDPYPAWTRKYGTHVSPD